MEYAPENVEQAPQISRSDKKVKSEYVGDSGLNPVRTRIVESSFSTSNQNPSYGSKKTSVFYDLSFHSAHTQRTPIQLVNNKLPENTVTIEVPNKLAQTTAFVDQSSNRKKQTTAFVDQSSNRKKSPEKNENYQSLITSDNLCSGNLASVIQNVDWFDGLTVRKFVNLIL